MIEFNCLIHKETGTVINYRDWKEKLEHDNLIVWKDKELNGTWQYKPKNILFNDDFEIIYNSEFMLKELIALDDCIAVAVNEDLGYRDLAIEYNLRNKIATKAKEYMNLKDKYKIEVVNS